MLVSISNYAITPGEEREVFLSPAFKVKVREIGARLCSLGGIGSMRLAHEDVKDAAKADPMRRYDCHQLELAWDEIGGWCM